MESKAIDNFLKGLISRVSDDKIADNAFSDCMNIDLSENYLPKSVKGKIKVNSVALDTKPCQGMTIYNNKELGSLMIVACGGYIYYSPLNTDNFQKYKIDNAGTLEDVVIDENVRVRFVQYNDRIFVFTGKYPVIENEDFSNACILVLYKTTATFINRDSFYAWTKSGSIFYTLSATPTNGDVIFSDLYRTKISATVSSYDSSNNKFTDSDNTEYTRTTNSDKIDNNIPKGLKIGFIHQERLFGLGSIEDESGIYWSQPYDPTRWTPVYGLNYDTVGKDDGEIITGGASFGGAYVYIFKQHNVYRYLTNGDIDQWSSNKVDTTYGCVAHETIRLFNGLLTYLSPEGVAQLNGNSAVLIDEQINNKTANISIGEEIALQRSYTKKSNWKNIGSITNGITVKNNVIGVVKDINIGNSSQERQLSDYDYLGDNGIIENEEVKMRADSYSISYDSSLSALSMCDWGASDPGSAVSSLPLLNKKINVSCVYIRMSGAVVGNGSVSATDYAQMDILTARGGSVVAQSEKVPLQDLIYHSNVAWNPIKKFQFNRFSIPANTQYWMRIRVVASGNWGSFYAYMSSNAGNGFYAYNGTYVNSKRFCVALTNETEDDYTYITKEIDTYSENFNLSQLLAYTNSLYTFTRKVYFANYDESKDDWSEISNEDISEVVSSTLTGTGKRYIRVKVLFKISNSWVSSSIFNSNNLSVSYNRLTSIYIPLTNNYDYQSEPISISGKNPSAWSIAEIIQSGSNDVSNKATVYMRAGTADDISSATYIEINNNEQISSLIPLKPYIQFKVSFPSGSDNEISSIKISYYTTEAQTKVCAFVWKNKYRLNMPIDNQSNNNEIEYIYDKDGYWTIKNNEDNFDYCASVDNLFACSQTNGIIYRKETGYKNDTENYNSYFVTKRFVLSDFENLYRKFKVRFVSVLVDITIGVSVDNGDFVDYTIPKNSNLIEVIKTLTGIVRGQSIKFKFSWQANDSTQIHNLIWYWQVLRELNRG